jgi:hypothetical protein
MNLITMWGERRDYEGMQPELMVAWDEITEEGNPEGFKQACEEARASWGDELAQWRIINLRAPTGLLIEAFAVRVLDAAVEPQA